jgi:hypothetical protein
MNKTPLYGDILHNMIHQPQYTMLSQRGTVNACHGSGTSGGATMRHSGPVVATLIVYNPVSADSVESGIRNEIKIRYRAIRQVPGDIGG